MLPISLQDIPYTDRNSKIGDSRLEFSAMDHSYNMLTKHSQWKRFAECENL